MRILAIETSCDETAIALVEVDFADNRIEARKVRSELFSQIDIHKEYGGVFPAVAKREHARHAPLLLERILDAEGLRETASGRQPAAGTDPWPEIERMLEREPDLFGKTREVLESHGKPDIDLVAVTQGPGLEPALWVGINFAKALSLYWNVPLVAANHMKGHIFSVLLNRQDIAFPALALLISGGHTELVDMGSASRFEIVGRTKDDAVGESYDKVARMLGLEYPGGPKVAALAREARESGLERGGISLPRPMIHSDDLDFSFSGLKTAVLYKVRDLGDLTDDLRRQLAREFEEAVCDVLLAKLARAISLKPYKTLVVSGGVVANEYLRSRIRAFADREGIRVLFPDLEDSTDNAQMIAVAGALAARETQPTVNPEIRADGNLGY